MENHPKSDEVEAGYEQDILDQNVSETMGEKTLEITRVLNGEEQDDGVSEIVQSLSEIIEAAKNDPSWSEEVEQQMIEKFNLAMTTAKELGVVDKVLEAFSDNSDFYESGLFGAMLDGGHVSLREAAKYGGDYFELLCTETDFLEDKVEEILVSDGEITEEQLEVLSYMKERGINILDFAASIDTSEDQTMIQADVDEEWIDDAVKRSNRFYDILEEHGLIDREEIIKSYPAVFREYYLNKGGAYMASIFVDRAMKDYEGDLPQDDYWIKTIKKKGGGELLTFAKSISEADKDLFDRYDFKDDSVKVAFFETIRCGHPWKADELFTNDGMKRLMRDPSTVPVMMQFFENSPGNEFDSFYYGGLLAALLSDKRILKEWMDNGAFDDPELCKKWDVFNKVKDGSLTEKERLGIVLGRLRDDHFDENGNPKDDVLNDFETERTICFYDESFQRKYVQKCLNEGRLDRLGKIDKDIISGTEGISNTESVFIGYYDKTREYLGYTCANMTREEIAKYFSESGPKAEFFTEYLIAHHYGVFITGCSAERRQAMDLNDAVYVEVLKKLYEKGSMHDYDFADVDREFAHAILGEGENIDDYLDLMSYFTTSRMSKGLSRAGTFGKTGSLEALGKMITLDNISEYYVDGEITDAFKEGPLKEFSLEGLTCMSKETKEALKISDDELAQMIRDKYYGSDARVIDVFCLKDSEIKRIFSDDLALLTFIELFRDSVRYGNISYNLRASKMSKYFSASGPTGDFVRMCIAEGDTEWIDNMSAEQRQYAGFTPAMESLLKGMSYNPILAQEGEEIDESNVLAALARFIKMDVNDWANASESDLRIKEAFSEGNIQNKNLAMEMLKREYAIFLKTGELPTSLRCFATYMWKNDGAGPLTQIEAFLDYCGTLGTIMEGVDDAGEDPLRTGLTAREIAGSVSNIERRIRKWDDQEKANFYAISAEVMQADPLIWLDFLDVFERIKEEEDFTVFAKEIYPLYRAKLALLKRYEDHSNGVGDGFSRASYKGVDKEELRNDLHLALLPFSFEGRGDAEGAEAYEERRRTGIERVKQRIFGEISELFVEKFGISPDVIPLELDKSAMRSIEDMVLYLSNINDPDEEKKDTIGFFLALQLNKGESGETRWDDLRAGKQIDPYDYLEAGAAFNVESALRASEAVNPITAENTGISDPVRLESFRAALQHETSEIRTGSPLTVDVKLQSISQNIVELMDPDLYDDPLDKAKIELLRVYGPKTINGAATKLWLRESGKKAEFSAEEEEVARGLERMLTDNGIEVTPQNINAYLQRGFKDLGKIFAAYDVIDDSDITGTVDELQTLLMPQGEVAAIFEEMGEEFRPHSGILALAADIEFLESVVMKAEKVGILSGDEVERARKIELVKGYLGQVKAKFTEINTLYDEVVKKFENIKIQPTEDNDGGRDKLMRKLQEIRTLIGSREGGAQSSITTRCSNKMTTIIENMRACLSCKTKGINNDTDLSFGESYKFYLYSGAGTAEIGSSSDEIVYFVPVGDGEDRRMSFVMDRVYGNKNGDIYYSHVSTLVKKAKDLKKKFPEAKISIFLTASSASSCAVALDAKILTAKVGIPESAQVAIQDDLPVHIPQSGFGDHYIEIGGGARTSGTRRVGGIEIIF